MKLRTSYCKLTTFKKDLTRFAPVWALYFIGMLMVLMESMAYGSYDYIAEGVMPSLVMSFGIVNLCYAGVCALVLFGDLYNTRMCYSLHTQPARRESLFASHLAAALCFSLVPNALVAIFMVSRLDAYWGLALYWLLASELQFVFYFGVASVAAMCAGNRVGMLAIYAVLNFFSMIGYWVVNTIYLPNMTGVVLDLGGFSTVCPTVKLFQFDYFQFERIEQWDKDFMDYTFFYQYTGLGDGWGYLAILGVVGLAALGLAVLLYRLRHLESAGDFVAFSKLSPVAGVVLTICVAVGFAFFGEALGSGYKLWLAVGLVVGWFGSRMLLERRVKVFRLKNFLGLGAMTAVVAVSFLVIFFDIFNIVGYLPKKDQVEFVTISNYKNNNYYMDDYYYGNRITVKLEKPEEIEEILEAHADILDRMDRQHNSVHRITFSYKLKSGRTVIRSYAAPANGVNYNIVRKYFYSPQQLLGYKDWDTYVKNIDQMHIDGYDIPREYREAFLQALYDDCKAGHVTTSNDVKTEIVHWVYLLSQEDPDRPISRELVITDQAVNTLALMKKPQFLLGFESMDQVDGILFMSVNGNEVDATQYESLLEALLKDAQEGTLQLADHKEQYDYVFVEFNVKLGNGRYHRYVAADKYAKHTRAWMEENS